MAKIFSRRADEVEIPIGLRKLADELGIKQRRFYLQNDDSFVIRGKVGPLTAQLHESEAGDVKFVLFSQDGAKEFDINGYSPENLKGIIDKNIQAVSASRSRGMAKNRIKSNKTGDQGMVIPNISDLDDASPRNKKMEGDLDINSETGKDAAMQALMEYGYSKEEAMALLAGDDLGMMEDDMDMEMMASAADKDKVMSAAEDDVDDTDIEDDEFEMDEEFMKEVNDESEFMEGEMDLSKEDVVEIIKVIDDLADIVLDVEGVEKAEMSDSSAADLLDSIDIMSRANLGQAYMPNPKENMMQEMAGMPVKMVNVLPAQGEPNPEYVEDLRVDTMPGMEEEGMVYTNTMMEEPVEFEEAMMAEEGVEPVAVVVLNSVNKVNSGDKFRIMQQVVKLDPYWMNQSVAHQASWEKSYEKVASQLGRKLNSAKDWGIVTALASRYLNQSIKKNEKVASAVKTLLESKSSVVKSSRNITRVASAMRKVVSGMIDGKDIFRNPVTERTEKITAPKGYLDGSDGYDADIGTKGQAKVATEVGQIQPFHSDLTINYKGKEYAVMAKPVEGDGKGTEGLAEFTLMKETGPAVYNSVKRVVMKSSINKTQFLKGDKAKEIVKAVQSSAAKEVEIPKSGDMVILNSSPGKALYLKSSAVCGGLIAVEAPYKKGINNSKYSLFSSAGSNKMVDSKGNFFLTSKANRFAIVSPASNKGVKAGEDTVDVFSHIEAEYVKSLKSEIPRLVASSAARIESLQRQLDVKTKQLDLKKKVVSSLKRENEKLQLESDGTINSLLVSSRQKEKETLLKTNSAVVKSEDERTAIQSSKNQDFLTRSMRRM